MNVYNEIEPNAVEWLKNLMRDGRIPAGRVDERPIQRLTGGDIVDASQFHTFAGIGGWPYALELAGWPDDEEVWTGSCPCQPFSAAGRGRGVEDERHLWPEFLRLIRERLPPTVFGEQVASKAGRQWVVGVRADLEALGYRVGISDLCAASVGAPHIRQRLYWVADRAGGQEHTERGVGQPGRDPLGWPPKTPPERTPGNVSPSGFRAAGGLGDGESRGRREVGEDAGGCGEGTGNAPLDRPADGSGVAGGLGDARRERDERRGDPGHFSRTPSAHEGEARQRQRDGDADCVPSATQRLADDDDTRLQDGGPRRPESRRSAVAFWDDFRVVPCTDGKARRTGARVFPLAYGLPRGVGQSGSELGRLARRASRARTGTLEGSGNAIVPELAAVFIRAYLDARKIP